MTTTTTTTPPADKFERKTCSRCGGSGSYSYCQMHGSTCFGCGGKGKVLSKRGQAARAFYLASITKPASDVVAGDLLRMTSGKFARVESVSTTERAAHSNGTWYDYVNFHFPRLTVSEFPASSVQSVKSHSERVEKLAAAFAHQATLTETGRPRRR